MAPVGLLMAVAGFHWGLLGVAAAAVAARKAEQMRSGERAQVERAEKGADDLGDKGFDKYFGHGRINALNSLTK